MNRKAYPSDVSDEEWMFVAPYLALISEEAPQRVHSLREVFNGLRYIIRGGITWRMMPNDLPPWEMVYQQTQRWLKAGVFEAMVHDLRTLLRVAEGRQEQPSAAIFDSRTLQSSPESGQRAGYDGAKRRKGSKTHMAVDTLGLLLAMHITAADEQDRSQVMQLAQQVQRVTGDSVEVAFVDQGYYRRRRGASGRRTGNASGSGQASRSKERLCSAAASLGCRAEFRVGGAFPPSCPRLRTITCNPQAPSFPRLLPTHAQPLYLVYGLLYLSP